MSASSRFGYPTPPTTRRSGQSSEDYTSTRGAFGISNVQFRAGAPPLRQLPLKTIQDSVSLSISRDFGPEIDVAVYDILKENGVLGNQERVVEIGNNDPNWTHWMICSRRGEETPYSAECTLLVLSPWAATVPDCWQNGVRDLKVWIDSFLDSKHRQGVDVHIEIMDKWLYANKYISPVLGRPDLDKDWEPIIKATVRSLLQDYEPLKNNWNCVALFRYGPNKWSPNNNPCTIYISFDRDCDEIKWVPFRKALHEFLDSTTYKLRIHLEHAAPELLSKFELLTPNRRFQGNEPLLTHCIPYDTKANMGTDISASRYIEAGELPAINQVNSTVGTLGCYIQLQFKGEQWQTFILTNYHVVRSAFDGFRLDSNNRLLAPEKGTALYAADHGGFRHLSLAAPSTAPGVDPSALPSADMENPSRVRHNRNIGHLERLFLEERNQTKKKEWKKLRDTKKSFFYQEYHHLGSLFAGSGFTYRTERNGILDWALIKPVPGRIGRNTLPIESKWPQNENRPAPETFGAQLRHHISMDVKSFTRERVFKFGAITGPNCGIFSAHKTDVQCLDWKYMNEKTDPTPVTAEYAFMSLPNNDDQFSKPGDSGTVVWNEEGRAAGLLFRGQPSENSAMFSYITPMEYVFRHISSFLGAKIRIPEFSQF